MQCEINGGPTALFHCQLLIADCFIADCSQSRLTVFLLQPIEDQIFIRLRPKHIELRHLNCLNN